MVPPSVDHLAGQPIWSESAYLDCVSEDGMTGFVLRLSRYPSAGTGWLWCHVFLPSGVYAYTDHYLTCGSERTAVESAGVHYGLDGTVDAGMTRSGERGSPEFARATVSVRAHADRNAGHGPGDVPVRVAAIFWPLSASRTVVPGRIELLGRVEGKISVGRSEVDIVGLGQWHEQHQEAPRFQAPFIYMTLRGADLALVGTIGPRRSTGYVRRGNELTQIDALAVSARAPARAIRISLADGSVLAGSLETTHEYSVPIFERRRPGTLVRGTIDGHPVSGCVNDYMRD